MKRFRLQADLDPPNWPIKRPGGYAAERAVEQTRSQDRDKEEEVIETRGTRPGGAAAARLVKALRKKRQKQ